MARWSEKQLQDYQGRRRFGALRPSTVVLDAKPETTRDESDESRRGRTVGSIPATTAKSRYYALGRLPTGKMNGLESSYDKYLWELRAAGEVLWHKFEGIKLRLADNTFYTCDFAVLPKSGFLELHECKGWWQDKGRVKIKVAAEMYPFKFIAVKKAKGGWQIEEFGFSQ
jgi:hypothetical protein